MDIFEQRVIELTRKGDMEKVGWLRNMDRAIRPTQLLRIQQNDRTVLGELVLPSWVTWELLRDWASTRKIRTGGQRCIFCGETGEVGIDFMEKFVCDVCFLRLKNKE